MAAARVVTKTDLSIDALKAAGAAEGLRLEALGRLSRAASNVREANRGNATDPRLKSARELVVGALAILNELIVDNGSAR